jgi:hypothetical protein
MTIVVAMFVIGCSSLFPLQQSCTNISLTRDGQVLFANNEDTHFRDLVIGFFPAGSEGYGSVHVGFRQPDGVIQFGGVMNDKGLAWDLNTAPRSPLNPHPEKPYSHEEDNYLSTISKQAATVEEAIQIARRFDFGDSMAYQFHIADASGDAVVISAGLDGELAFTRKDQVDSYLLLTNFNPANHKDREVGWRYQTASAMLEEIDSSSGSIYAYAGGILDAVHLNNLTSYTLYSNIFDLKNKEIHLYYMAQYDEVVVLNLADELARGARVVDMREFFSPETVAAGDAAYHRFEARFNAAKIAVIALVVGIVAGGAFLAVRKTRKQQQGDEPRRPNLGVIIKIL